MTSTSKVLVVAAWSEAGGNALWSLRVARLRPPNQRNSQVVVSRVARAYRGAERRVWCGDTSVVYNVASGEVVQVSVDVGDRSWSQAQDFAVDAFLRHAAVAHRLLQSDSVGRAILGETTVLGSWVLNCEAKR